MFSPGGIFYPAVKHLLRLQSRFGDKLLNFQVVSPPNGAAVLKRLNEGVWGSRATWSIHRRTTKQKNKEKKARAAREQKGWDPNRHKSTRGFIPERTTSPSAATVQYGARRFGLWGERIPRARQQSVRLLLQSLGLYTTAARLFSKIERNERVRLFRFPQHPLFPTGTQNSCTFLWDHFCFYFLRKKKTTATI